MYRLIGVFLSLFLLVLSCEQAYVPKPKGYNRIFLPQPSYQTLPDTLPYFFEYSKHAVLKADSGWVTGRYWMHVFYPSMKADIHLTYKPIKQKSVLPEYLHDAYKLTSQHNIKASAIEEQILVFETGLVVSLTELEGEVPSQVQFHCTDSINHFLRGALYFETSTKNDSLAPVISYIKNDILHMLATLKWNN